MEYTRYFTCLLLSKTRGEETTRVDAPSSRAEYLLKAFPVRGKRSERTEHLNLESPFN